MRPTGSCTQRASTAAGRARPRASADSRGRPGSRARRPSGREARGCDRGSARRVGRAARCDPARARKPHHLRERLYTKAILDARGIDGPVLLVTSAAHMGRRWPVRERRALRSSAGIARPLRSSSHRRRASCPRPAPRRKLRRDRRACDAGRKRGVLAAGVAVGSSGGALVYRHGAASGYTSDVTATAPGAAGVDRRATTTDDPRVQSAPSSAARIGIAPAPGQFVEPGAQQRDRGQDRALVIDARRPRSRARRRRATRSASPPRAPPRARRRRRLRRSRAGSARAASSRAGCSRASRARNQVVASRVVVGEELGREHVARLCGSAATIASPS